MCCECVCVSIERERCNYNYLCVFNIYICRCVCVRLSLTLHGGRQRLNFTSVCVHIQICCHHVSQRRTVNRVWVVWGGILLYFECVHVCSTTLRLRLRLFQSARASLEKNGVWFVDYKFGAQTWGGEHTQNEGPNAIQKIALTTISGDNRRIYPTTIARR